MKIKTRKRLITAGLLLAAMVLSVEFQKYLKRKSPPCKDGICTLPAEKAGAIVGPQSVPLPFPAGSVRPAETNEVNPARQAATE